MVLFASLPGAGNTGVPLEETVVSLLLSVYIFKVNNMDY